MKSYSGAWQVALFVSHFILFCCFGSSKSGGIERSLWSRLHVGYVTTVILGLGLSFSLDGIREGKGKGKGKQEAGHELLEAWMAGKGRIQVEGHLGSNRRNGVQRLFCLPRTATQESGSQHDNLMTEHVG